MGGVFSIECSRLSFFPIVQSTIVRPLRRVHTLGKALFMLNMLWIWARFGG